MDSSSQDKNLPATPQRLKKARDDGQVARSKDLSNLAVLGGGMLVLFGLAPTGFARMRDTLAGQLRFDNASVRTPELMLQRLSDNAAQALIVYLPLGLLVIALAVVALIAAGSVALSTKPIEPKLSN
ncbi:EscU/YscU/HrcU family type III secretion system export apparatus switch protein, partial [Hydrogenophaga sp. 70-12]